MKVSIFTFIILILFFNHSYAYVGPGMGGGILAATIGIIVAIFAAFFGLLWFPIKRLINKNKKKNENKNNETESLEKKEK